MADTKVEFETWLKIGNAKKFSPSFCVSNIEEVSRWTIEKNISKVGLFDITDFCMFDQIQNKILGNKLFRIIHKNTYKAFEKTGGLYLHFLKEKGSGKFVYMADSEQEIKSQPKNYLSATSTIKEKVTYLLSLHFGNGFRLNSPIELIRFRAFSEDLGEELLISDDMLKDIIANCGMNYDSKIYVVSIETIKCVVQEVIRYLGNGAQVIFYSEFYSKNESWLFKANIVSEEMLTDILRRELSELCHTQTYFGTTNTSVFTALESEILRVWGENVLRSYKQLAARLKYIPIARIKYALGQNSDFIYNSAETYTHISKIDITDADREEICNTAVKNCNAHGFTSIADMPFGEIFERNEALSITAIHNAIFRMCLLDKFDQKGKIVTRKGDTLDALSITKDYCRTIDKCTLDDLLQFERELTGEVHRWIPMVAANSTLIRVDKDIFVADRYVYFNIEAIDVAIERFMKNDYLPLKSFTTFGTFPDCGYNWNLFLLESYCHRFSRAFRFDTPTVNSRNAGTIIRKSNGQSYIDIMANAVANADIDLEESAIGKFLYENGFTGRSSTSKANEIIDKARALRERRN